MSVIIKEEKKHSSTSNKHTSSKTNSKITVPYERGVKLIHNPVYNKGTAFTHVERKILGLRGLLPPKAISQDLQSIRVIENIRKKPDDLSKYNHMVALQDRNENLYYYVLMKHLEELMPIVYTPTVGKACQEFGHIYRKPRGLYISVKDKGHIREILLNWPTKDIKVIVVTDGGRILGLGDLGVNGMGIPIGKLALYTSCAGIKPTSCLPITVDVGTNNETLLNDPLYLGCKHERTTGQEYIELFDEFIEAVQDIFPDTLIQFEDFSTQNAFDLLKRYRDRARVFNDDIQGTASVAFAGLLSALRIKKEDLSNQKILFMGAGEAGIGIADMISLGMEQTGISPEEAKKRNWFFDSKGLVCAERTDLASHKQSYAHEHEFIDNFEDAIKILKPTAIIGVSGQQGKFNESVVKLMHEINEQPIIFALSNPTSKSECTAEQAYQWTDGKAIFASGSPFDPVNINGKTLIPGQGNNVYIFPGIGLGLYNCLAKTVSNRMFYKAAKVVSKMVTEEELNNGTVYPSFKRIREVSVQIAMEVIKVGIEEGIVPGHYLTNMEDTIKASMYTPEYPEYM